MKGEATGDGRAAPLAAPLAAPQAVTFVLLGGGELDNRVLVFAGDPHAQTPLPRRSTHSRSPLRYLTLCYSTFPPRLTRVPPAR